jgi:lactate racemase
MKISFPYRGYEAIESVIVPDANLLGVYSPRTIGEINEEEILARGFAEPHHAVRLREAVKPTDRVLILIDDATRGTPVPRILHHVIRELWAAEVLDTQVALLTAQGTHREMGEQELTQKLREFYGRFEVQQHRWLDELSLHDFGRTSDGTRITANRLLLGADLVIGLGRLCRTASKAFPAEQR